MSSQPLSSLLADVGSISNGGLAARRQHDHLALEVDRGLGRRGVEQLAHVVASGTITHSRPFLAQLERKMSANDGATMAR